MLFSSPLEFASVPFVSQCLRERAAIGAVIRRRDASGNVPSPASVKQPAIVPLAEVLAVFFGADATFLARIQFAFTVAFHIVFPAFTIGLSSYIATLEGAGFFSGDGRFHRLARYWTKIFAVSFAMGVVSGVPMSYQFGTNWSQFSIATGNVIGPLLGYEVLMAFFLELSFLGVMLFGRNRVPPWLHFFASLMVAFGTLLSAFWILAANSWMQYPAGHEIRDGIAYPVDWTPGDFQPDIPLALCAYGGGRLPHDRHCGAGRGRPLSACGQVP